MKKNMRTLFVPAVATALIATWAGPAHAAQPTNDRVAGAKVVTLGSLPKLDTTSATTDADDRALVQSCGPVGPGVTDASVWYSFTPAVDGSVNVDVSSSNYSAGVIVATGTPGHWKAEVCHPRSVTFRAKVGTSYRILAFDDQGDGGGNGGQLGLSLSAVAAGPANDALSGATSAGLGFHQQLDTTRATSDADDIAANASCPNPAGATDASVWYAFTPTTTGRVTVDVSGSNYSAGVFVLGGTPGSSPALSCGPRSVTFSATAGTTYRVVTFDDQGDGGGNGGLLDISFTPAADVPAWCTTLLRLPPPVLAALPPQVLGIIEQLCGR